MNLRDIKKDIEYVLGAFIEDCSVAATIGAKAADEEMAKLYESAIDLYNELKDKANSKVEGPRKAYFAALRKEILEKTDALYEELSAVVKKANEPVSKPEPAKKPAAKKPAAKKAPAKKAAKAEE